MFIIMNIKFLMCILIIGSVICSEEKGKNKDDTSDSSDGESDEKESETISPNLEKLEESIIKKQEENAEKFDVPLTSPPEKIEEFLKNEEKEFGTDLPEHIEGELKEDGEIGDFIHYVHLYDKIEHGGTAYGEPVKAKSPAEMKKMKEDLFELINELHEKHEKPKMSQEEFDAEWERNKGEIESMRNLFHILKSAGVVEEFTTSAKIISEAVTEGSTPEATEEEVPKATFVVKNAKEKICILARFNATISFTKSEKLEITVPSSGHVKGKCGKSPYLEISWGKFVFILNFEKTSNDSSWSMTSVDFNYDTSEALFDGADNRRKVSTKSNEINLFETPIGKSYVCHGQEVILLYSGDEQLATVQIKGVHLQPYNVTDGKFSPSHHCNQVLIDSLDEEPFVHDETIPLAVGCTLALITLLILVGFSVHRAYNAAKVDYNTMP